MVYTLCDQKDPCSCHRSDEMEFGFLIFGGESFGLLVCCHGAAVGPQRRWWLYIIQRELHKGISKHGNLLGYHRQRWLPCALCSAACRGLAAQAALMNSFFDSCLQEVLLEETVAKGCAAPGMWHLIREGLTLQVLLVFGWGTTKRSWQ